MSFLFSRGFEAPVALVASYRSDDLHRRHPLRRQVAEWARMAGVERIQLEPLAAADVRRLVEQLHPVPLPEERVRDIVTRAEGNAFFVEELVGASSARTGGIPEDLADVLLVRLEGLDDAAVTVVRAAAVAGRRVSHAALSAVVDLPPADLDRAVRDAVEGHVLVPSRDDYYQFRHALLAEAVYDDLLPGERTVAPRGVRAGPAGRPRHRHGRRAGPPRPPGQGLRHRPHREPARRRRRPRRGRRRGGRAALPPGARPVARHPAARRHRPRPARGWSASSPTP